MVLILKHCNSDMRIDLQLLVPVFLCLYSIYSVAMLYFSIFFINCFALLLFFVNLQYFSSLLQDLFAIFTKIFRNKLFALFSLTSFRIFWITFKIEMSNEKTDFIKKNENNCNFYSIVSFVYYKL